MNILQLQDRLKGLPEKNLVNYVTQPTGEVPIFLALSELQRRNEMKKRFQANQAEKPSIAEQIVAESKPDPMQMGLGNMRVGQRMMPGGQGVGTPPLAPEMDPRQMAASGIAANPQSAVGGSAMAKEGGIVGYQTGGITGYSDEFIKMLEEQAKLNQGTGGPYGGSIVGESSRFIPKTIVDAQGNIVPFAGSSQRIPILNSFGQPTGKFRTAPFNTDEYDSGSTGRARTKQIGEYVPFGEGTFAGDLSDPDSPERTGFFGFGGYEGEQRQAKKQIEEEEKLYGDAFMSKKEREAMNFPTLEEQAQIKSSAQQDKNQSITSGGQVGNYDNGVYVGPGKDPLSDGAFDITQKQTKKNIDDDDDTTDPDKDDEEIKDKVTSFRDNIEEYVRKAMLDLDQDPTAARDKYRKELELYGIDPNFFEDAKKQNINTSLIEAGLRIAGGTSANPLENISKGAIPSIEAFKKEQSRLSGAQRLENLAGLKAYQDKQKELRALAVALYGQDRTADAASAEAQANMVQFAITKSQAEMDRLYGKGQAGVYFGTAEGSEKYKQLLDHYYKKFLFQQMYPGKVYKSPGIYIPYKGGQIDLTKPENLSQDVINYLDTGKST